MSRRLSSPRIVLATLAMIGFQAVSPVLMPAPALAEDVKPDSNQDRFTLVTTRDGVIRVDKASGAVTFCRQVNTSLRCVLAADERQAWQAETEALSEKIKTLETRIATLEGQASADSSPSKGQNTDDATKTEEEGIFSKKTQRELDEITTKAERVLRGLVGAMKDLGKDLATDPNAN